MSGHGSQESRLADDGAGGVEGQPIDIGLVPFDGAPPGGDEPHDVDGLRDVAGPDGDRRSGRPSRTRLIVLGSLLAVGLAGAAVIGTAGYRVAAQKDATLDTPEQLTGLRRNDSEDARATADYLRSALSAEVDLDGAVGAVYTDPARAERSVLFFGGTGLIWTPEGDLETAFELVSDDTGAVTGLRDVPAGELGGAMKCGTTASPDGDIAVCGWADHGSLALAMFPNRSAADAAPLLLSIRNEVQTRK